MVLETLIFYFINLYFKGFSVSVGISLLTHNRKKKPIQTVKQKSLLKKQLR